ncbi:MAG: shikimate dehydrogenase [Ruminococcaceae bacterium]|nr:shikimate dehydrogenase [Oscillospiraceae bacterium]
MKFGLIGEHLGHSFSKAIHEKIGGYVYEIKEIEPQKVEAFFKERDFVGVNVTIPYKEKVIPMLDFIDEHAKKIGAVNTVINKNGKLYGYNTDYMGLKSLVLRTGTEIEGKKVLVIGTGGTSKTARAVIGDMGAKEILFVSHRKTDTALTYEEVYAFHTDVDVIFNTSPVGMYPNNDTSPIDLTRFPKLTAVIDVVYNPIKTKLVKEAQALGIKASAGLYMLSAQAVYAYELFSGNEATKELCDSIFKSVIKEKSNIILVGMPSSGKTSVGKRLATLTGKQFVDTDDELVKREGIDIPTIFANKGEGYFRDLESKTIEDVSKLNGLVIATGGGAVLRNTNVDSLKQNGKIYFIDRSLENLMPTEDRPLSSTREAIEKRYNERYQIYKESADVIVNGDGSVNEVAEEIYKEYLK